SSSSPVPKIGSVYNQFQKGVFDYILFTRRTASTTYVSNHGINLVTSTSGSIDDPLRTIQFSLFHTTSSQTQSAHIFLFTGIFAEQSLFVGGHCLSIIGTAEGQMEPRQQQQTGNQPGPSLIQNTKETNQDLIQLYDGIITLQLLIIRLDNSDDKYMPFGAIAIHGKQSSCTIEYCSFTVVNPRIYLDKEFISIDRGENLTMRYSSVYNIIEENCPILYIAVSEKSNLLMQQVNVTSCKINESSSGVIHLQYFTGGIATIDQCKFNYDVAVTFAFIGKKPFGGALLIQLCESPFSTSYIYGNAGQQLNNSRNFDSNIGDCSGAVTVSGTRSLLSEERILFVNCLFENNIAGSDFKWTNEPYGNDIYFYIIDASTIIYNETLSPLTYDTIIRSTFFNSCISYTLIPLVNFLGNKKGTEKLDQLLLSDTAQRQFVFYVALTGNDQNAGSKQYPLRMISHATAMLSRSDGYKEIIVLKGLFDEPMLVIRDLTLILTGHGCQVTSICNSKTKENTLLWLERGSNVIVQDCTLFRFSELSTTASLIDSDLGSRIIVKRCVIFNDVTAEYGDVFNAGGVFTSGGIFDSVFQNSQMTNCISVRIGSQTDDFDFGLIESNSDGSCQFVTNDAEPENNPNPVLFQLRNVTFRHLSSNEPSTPSVAIYSTPNLDVSFEQCLFDENSYVLVQLTRSYYDTDKGHIGQVIFKHCTWSSNGKTWKTDGKNWYSDLIVECGALIVQYLNEQDDLKYTIGSEECKINIGSVIVDSCIFMDNIGLEVNDIQIEEDLLNTEQLITFNNCFRGSQIIATTPNYVTFTYDSITKSKIQVPLTSLSGLADVTTTLPNRNMIIDFTSTLIDGQLTEFVAMMIKQEPDYSIQFNVGIMVNETSLNVRNNKLSIFKDDNVQEEVIFRAKQIKPSPNYLPFQGNGAFIDSYSSSLIAVEQSGEISMKSIVLLHFYEKTLNSVIQIKDEAKFNGIQLIFRPIKEQLVGMKTLPTAEQTSPYLLCLGGFTILETCQFLPTNFIKSAAIRTMYEIGINSKEGAQYDDYNLTLIGSQLIGMNRINEAENSGAAIDAIGMKVTLEQCIFDMNTQQSNMMKNKINKTIKRNEDDQPQPEEHLIPTCRWNTAYIRQNTGRLILSKGTQFTNLNKGAISLLGANLTIADADVQFLNNIDNSMLQGIYRNGDDDQPVTMKPTLLRRNIACGYGSRITSPIESFSENGLQEDSLWILKTDEGKKIENEQQDNVYENECQLDGGLQNVKSPLFIPHIDKASGIMSKDQLGLDITIIGRHLIRCGVVKYKVCEKIKVINDDGQEIEEKILERELHCQTQLMENALQWENEMEIVIQTRYQIVRKWKPMQVWLIFADGSQISEILDINIGKLSVSSILIIVLVCAVLVINALIALIVVLFFEYKQKKKKIFAMRQNEEESVRQVNQEQMQDFNEQQRQLLANSSQYE
ncbi:MAG: hypothetical protein EZS28_019520, partial [Streblomastix strix]